MRKFGFCALALGALAAVVAGRLAQGDEKDAEPKPKHTIKEVMKLAHKDGLLKKVTDGGASKEDKDKLLDVYISMIENKPPKGELQAWQMKSGMAILAAAKVAVGREGAEAELKKATDCKGCHTDHKG